jgi:hypothetical protein
MQQYWSNAIVKQPDDMQDCKYCGAHPVALRLSQAVHVLGDKALARGRHGQVALCSTYQALNVGWKLSKQEHKGNHVFCNRAVGGISRVVPPPHNHESPEPTMNLAGALHHYCSHRDCNAVTAMQGSSTASSFQTEHNCQSPSALPHDISYTICSDYYTGNAAVTHVLIV